MTNEILFEERFNVTAGTHHWTIEKEGTDVIFRHVGYRTKKLMRITFENYEKALAILKESVLNGKEDKSVYLFSCGYLDSKEQIQPYLENIKKKLWQIAFAVRDRKHSPKSPLYDIFFNASII